MTALIPIAGKRRVFILLVARQVIRPPPPPTPSSYTFISLYLITDPYMHIQPIENVS